LRFFSPPKIFGTLFLYRIGEMTDMNVTGKIITGLLLGSLIGLATGLLIAPTTGKQTRKKIGKKSKKIAKQVAGYIGIEQTIQGGASKRKNGKSPVEAQ
jgi:gas vesicle protein